MTRWNVEVSGLGNGLRNGSSCHFGCFLAKGGNKVDAQVLLVRLLGSKASKQKR